MHESPFSLLYPLAFALGMTLLYTIGFATLINLHLFLQALRSSMAFGQAIAFHPSTVI